MAEVILKDLNKVYNNNLHVVKDNNLKIKDREFMVLVGPSGCGKSTTLRMIAGLEEITSGEILIGDKVVNNIAPKDRNIAMVFQDYALYPHMTVYNNMAFGLKLRKFSKEEIGKRVGNASDILGLNDYLERKPKALSGGQRQRVALGRAIVRQPKVFLFDEPLSNLDAKLRVQMRAEIIKLHKRLKATMIYVTHDQTEAITMGDRICVLNEGIIQQCDTPLNLYDAPANVFVAGFIGSPAMNLVSGELISDNGKLFFVEGKQIRIPLPQKYYERVKNYIGKKIIFGIRPERIYPNNENPTVKLTVDVVEPMGNEIFIYFRVAGSPFICRVTTRDIPELDSEMNLKFDEEYMHFFDVETEKALV